jgi:dipeptidyl aminopeptidase/acylaminoacyl peptidase
VANRRRGRRARPLRRHRAPRLRLAGSLWADGHETPLPLAAGSYRHPRLSPTGDRLAIASENGGGDIFLANLTLKNPQLSRLTFRDEEDWMPVWMPTGDGIVFGSRSGGGVSNLFVQRLDDAITVGSTIDLFRGRYLVRDGTHYRQYDVAPDGRFLMLKYQRPTEQGHFVLVQGWTSELQRLVR